jgi:hypothetical protein
MPPVIVFKRLKLEGQGIGPEAGESLRAIPTEGLSEADLIAEKEKVEEQLRKMGEFPVLAVSPEILEQEKIDEINTNSPLGPVTEA